MHATTEDYVADVSVHQNAQHPDGHSKVGQVVDLEAMTYGFVQDSLFEVQTHATVQNCLAFEDSSQVGQGEEVGDPFMQTSAYRYAHFEVHCRKQD